MNSDQRILEEARRVSGERPRFKPQEDRGELPRVGDIRLARSLPPSSNTQRLVLVLDVHQELNHAEVCLLSNEADMMSDFDVLLPRDETGLPFDLVAEFDLVAPVFIIQTTDLLGRMASESLIEDLRSASSRDFSNIRPGVRGLPIRGQEDPRWIFKEEELSDLQTLSRECTSDIVEGKVTAKPIVDPALLDEIIDLAGPGPVECPEGLLSVAEEVQGGLVFPEQIDGLMDQLGELFAGDPTTQVALQPLLEAAISTDIVTSSASQVEFNPRRGSSDQDRNRQFSQLVAVAAEGGCASVIRVLTTASAWEADSALGSCVVVDIPGNEPLYADARDPRRAA